MQFELSTIILFVGAACILAFIVHGLWFSGRPQNRKLDQKNERDQAIQKSHEIGKVRIVTTELPDNQSPQSTDLGITAIDKNAAHTPQAQSGHMAMPEGLTEPSFNQETQAGEQYNQAQQTSYTPQGYLDENGEYVPGRTTYEIILTASPERPYLGAEIEAICNQYGFIQGFIQEHHKIYFVYENAATKEDEVFRICSMEPPYYFPENMQGFATSAIALYMSLPQRGKAFAYFKALRMASEIFISQLGGVMQDQYRQPLPPEALDQIALELQHYDGGRNAIK